jgi:nicotinamide-nucleotide amidase
MRAAVVAIGDELTSGQRLDTNSQWLSQRLVEVGVQTRLHITVGDELQPGVEAFRQAVAQSDVVVSSGGLGPTADDLTRHVLAELTGCELVLDEPSREHIRQLFARRQRPMPPQNEVQAMFPRGSRVLPNPHGTAPGIAVDLPRPGAAPVRVFALPGVPAEMREMFHATVVPQLLAACAGERPVIRSRCLKCFGVGESEVESRLPDLIRRGRTPTVGITVSEATISLRIVAEGPSAEVCEATIAPTVDTIRQCLGTLVFGEGDDELQDVVVRRLREQGRMLGSAECDSGGLLAQWLTAADPAGLVYRGGVVTRTAAAIPAVAQQDADGAAVVRALAAHVRRELQVDCALAVGPFPARQPDASGPGAVWFAWATPEGTLDRSAAYAGHPALLTPLALKRALDFVRHAAQ